MFRARRQRREQELRELGTLMACAFHEPKKLDSLFKPHLEDTLERAKKNPDEWEYDEWWRQEDAS